MTPIIFSSAEEQKCVSAYTNSILKSLFNLPQLMSFKLANWTGNLNYWTGGLQGSRGAWGLCDGANFIPIPENLTWAPNQPDNMLNEKENCLHMRIHKNESSTALSDRACTDKYIYACKVETQYTCISWSMNNK
jgi:hypothetical protein